MAKLDLYSDREALTVTVEKDGKPFELRLPSDFTVDEVERIYEFEAKRDENMSNLDIVLNQIFIMVHRYQPDWTIEDVKKVFSHKDTEKIFAFVLKHSSFVGTPSQEDIDEAKKKPLNKD